MSYHVYILKCADGSFYIGHTDSLIDRVGTHNSGQGARYTAIRRPVTLVYSEPALIKSDAVLRERQLKKWSRNKKQALVDGSLDKLKALARCHQKPSRPT